MEYINNIIKLIHKRHSVRNFSLRIIEKEKIQEISEFFNSNKKGPLGSDVRFQIIDGSAYTENELKKLGTYGLMKGANMYISGAVNRNKYAMEDFGYCMEKNILKATSLGLGTCWQGGTLNRSAFAKKMEISGNEIIAAVSPLGYAEDKNTFKGQMASFTMGSNKRKKVKEIFFDSNINIPLNVNEHQKFAIVLDCVRWSPSAGNMQPWRIIKENFKYHFYLKENSNYNNDNHFQWFFRGKGNKLQNIDMGIAMAHFELAATDLGLGGKWILSEPELDKGNLKYIVSWVSDAN
jgi:nitroreductase